jgi:hypothetical protein
VAVSVDTDVEYHYLPATVEDVGKAVRFGVASGLDLAVVWTSLMRRLNWDI